MTTLLWKPCAWAAVGFWTVLGVGHASAQIPKTVTSDTMIVRRDTNIDQPSEASRALFAQRMVPLLDDEERLLRDKIALIDAKKAQLLAPYDRAQALSVREREREWHLRAEQLRERKRIVMGLPGHPGTLAPDEAAPGQSARPTGARSSFGSRSGR